MSAVSVEGVGKHFGDVRAVDDVSLAVGQGRLLTLLGPSGCGKTTTLRMIAGLEPNDAGRIVIGERVVSDAARGMFVAPERRDIGMVFQSYAIWPHMSVFTNVAYPLQVRRRPSAEVRERALGALRLVQLEHLAARPATALSGGQQQRVAIARALVFQPRVLLMDEPLSNLDAQLREQMRLEIRALQQRLGITTIYVTHDQDEAMVLSDEIVVMHEGRVLQTGPPETLYAQPASRTVAAFFGVPNLLTAKASTLGAASPDRVLLRVRGDGWEGACQGPPARYSDELVTVVVRPETLHIAPAGRPRREAAITWRGVVRHRKFRGARTLYTVDVAGGRMVAEAPPGVGFAVGDAVTLDVELAHTWAVRD
jgi:iron(III) transport system ATP-binding protein